MNQIIATMTVARDRDEQHRILTSLHHLAALGLPIVVSDGGSPAAFLEQVAQVPGVEVVPPRSSGLVGQVATSLATARDRGAARVFYTEPDKLEFFRDRAARFLRAVPESPGLGVVLASRTPLAFGTFPAMQRATERAINTVMSELTGVIGDYCYGPFVVDASLLDDIEEIDHGIGWGWRFLIFIRALQRGRTIHLIEGEHTSPDEQLGETGNERIYRVSQLADNVLGVLRGLSMAGNRLHPAGNGIGV